MTRFLDLGVLGFELELLANNSGELPGGFNRLQPAIKIDGRLKARVPEQAAHCLVLTRMVYPEMPARSQSVLLATQNGRMRSGVFSAVAALAGRLVIGALIQIILVSVPWHYVGQAASHDQ
jgi:hypothetical protein